MRQLGGEGPGEVELVDVLVGHDAEEPPEGRVPCEGRGEGGQGGGGRGAGAGDAAVGRGCVWGKGCVLGGGGEGAALALVLALMEFGLVGLGLVWV